MALDIRWAIIIALGLIIAAYVHGGIYEMESSEGIAWRVNKFTGSVQVCISNLVCKRVSK